MMGHGRLSHMASRNHDRILLEAARRHSQLLASGCSPEAQGELRAWEEQGPDQQGASDLAQQVLTGVDRLSASDDYARKLKALADEALSAYPSQEQPKPVVHTRLSGLRKGVGVAAALAAIAVICQWQIDQGAQRVQASVFQTAGHERRTVTLQDGSRIDLDVGTRVEVRMSPERRDINLLSGRALFDVAHDARRPFSVTANDSRTVALGTQFQVENENGRVVVTLAQGSVAVDGSGPRLSTPWRERLQPGDQLSINVSTTERSRHFVDPQLVTSWTHGRHVFRGTPLHEALDEVNRYATRKVHLGDPSLANLPVAGNFVAGDSELVVKAFAAVLPLRVVSGGDEEIILFRRYGE